ncbi:3-oxoadipate CoA-transferase subunit B [compost metagenome]
MTEHLTKKGECKIVRHCTYPLTGVGCIDRIYSDLAVMDVTPQGLVVREIFGGLTPEQLQEVTPVELTFALQHGEHPHESSLSV